MAKRKPIGFLLSRNERVIAVVPQYCAGPGWANSPAWVLANSPALVFIEDTATTKLRTECLQPEEQSEALRTLFSVGAAMCAALVRAVPVEREEQA